MNKQTGGPAFPSGESYYTTDLSGNRTKHGKSPQYEGISMRDYFAAKAMQGLLASWGEHDMTDYEEFTYIAYKMADAMLAERAKGDL